MKRGYADKTDELVVLDARMSGVFNNGDVSWCWIAV